MSQDFDPKRRALSAGAALALLGFPLISIGGCGGGGSTPAGPSTPNPTPTPTPGSGDATGAIDFNHGHTAVILSAQLQAGNALSLSIQGSAPHDHTLDLSGAEVIAIRDRQRISKKSTLDSTHDHTVTFN